MERGPDALRRAFARLQDEGGAHVVVDAVSDADLTTIAQAYADMPLITGGSALAMPLPLFYQRAGLLSVDASNVARAIPDKSTIILSGSCSAMTNRQVASYLATGAPALRLDLLDLAQKGAAPALDWLASQSLEQAPILYATADPARVQAAQKALGVAKAGQVVEDTFAACALAARDADARRFVVAGGEISGAVAQALGVSQLDIGPEIAPGVPWTVSTSAGVAVALALKSGNFGAESYFADAQQRLGAT